MRDKRGRVSTDTNTKPTHRRSINRDVGGEEAELLLSHPRNLSNRILTSKAFRKTYARTLEICKYMYLSVCFTEYRYRYAVNGGQIVLRCLGTAETLVLTAWQQ